MEERRFGMTSFPHTTNQSHTIKKRQHLSQNRTIGITNGEIIKREKHTRGLPINPNAKKENSSNVHMRIVPDDGVGSSEMENQGHHDHMNQDLNVFNVVLLTKKIRIIVIKFQEV